MRINCLTLERYGSFTDRVLTFHPDAALHVVLGANESGKTSALSAIGDLLFGFGARTTYDFKHDSKLLRIGGTFRHSDGRTVAARRRKGNKNTLVDHADQPLPDDILGPFLGGVLREAFSREFGLTAETLRQGGDELLKAGGRLAETLAASSAGMSALSQVKEQLQSEADELFTPRRAGSKPFYVAADRRDNADRMLREAIVTREALQDKEAAVQEARAQLDALNAQHAQSGGTLARWQRTLRVRSKLARLESLVAELAVLADLPEVPAVSLAEWRAALEADAALGRELEALRTADIADTAEIAALAVDETLLAEGAAIDALRDRLGAIRKDFDDLPRRRQAREAAAAALDDLARRLALPSLAAMLDRQPTDAALAEARDLIERTRRADQVIADADARHARAQREHDDFAADHAQAQAISDPEPLWQRFEALGDIAAQADRLRRDTAALKIETDALAAAASALDPSPGVLQKLRTLPLPDNALVAGFAQDVTQNDDEAKQLRTTLSAIDATIAATEAELALLSSAGAMPNRADLAAARQQRDAHLDGLRAALDGDRANRETQFAEVVRASHGIDGITDLLLSDTERATRREDTQQRLVASRSERDRTAAMIAELQAKRAAIDQSWTQAWAASGLRPRSPAEMQRWRDRFDNILQRLAKLDAQQTGIDALAASLDAGKSAVIALLGSAGRVAERALAPDVLYREAKARLDELRIAWTDARTRAVSQQRIERDLRETAATRTTAERTLAQLHLAWPETMAGIALAENATLIQAEAALAVWQSVGVPKASYEREGRSVATMERDIAAFDHDVFDVVGRVAPQLKTESTQESLTRLSAMLNEMRRASDQRHRLHNAAAKRATARDSLLAQRAANASALGHARQKLACTDLAALAEPIERLTLRHHLETERTALQRDLQETGDGRDEAALRQERQGLDLDLLPGDITRETLRLEQLLKDIAAASAQLHQKQIERDVLLKGRDAGAAAAERAQASRELLSIAERWLLRAAAARLASRAIERHRAKVQDPLIGRASTLFATASGSAFAGLAIDYGDDDQPELKARRPDGERVTIAGLSEGSRDQLFLALRLALLERRTSEPMPFIGDDLLTSFDEPRTLATLRLLAAAGKQRQIILFTHHRHVAELARTVPDHIIDCIEL